MRREVVCRAVPEPHDHFTFKHSDKVASVADPGSGAFLTPGSGIREGKNKIRIRDSDPG